MLHVNGMCSTPKYSSQKHTMKRLKHRQKPLTHKKDKHISDNKTSLKVNVAERSKRETSVQQETTSGAFNTGQNVLKVVQSDRTDNPEFQECRKNVGRMWE